MRCGVQTSCLCNRASPLGFSDQRSGSGLLAKFLKRPSKGESVSDAWWACREPPGFCSLRKWSGRESTWVPTVYFSSSRWERPGRSLESGEDTAQPECGQEAAVTQQGRRAEALSGSAWHVLRVPGSQRPPPCRTRSCCDGPAPLCGFGAPTGMLCGFGAAFAFTSGLFTSFSREEARRKVLAAFGAELGGGGWGAASGQRNASLKRACVQR